MDAILAPALRKAEAGNVPALNPSQPAITMRPSTIEVQFLMKYVHLHQQEFEPLTSNLAHTRLSTTLYNLL